MGKKSVNEIDKIFASKKTVIVKPKDDSELETKPKKAITSQNKTTTTNSYKTTRDDELFSDMRGDQKRQRFTDDGMKIIPDHELNIGKGGNSKDCPFDCWCCF